MSLSQFLSETECHRKRSVRNFEASQNIFVLHFSKKKLNFFFKSLPTFEHDNYCKCIVFIALHKVDAWNETKWLSQIYSWFSGPHIKCKKKKLKKKKIRAILGLKYCCVIWENNRWALQIDFKKEKENNISTPMLLNKNYLFPLKRVNCNLSWLRTIKDPMKRAAKYKWDAFCCFT